MEFVDKRVPKARMARAMLESFNDIQDEIAKLKVAHEVAGFMEQKQRQDAIYEQLVGATELSDKMEEKMVERFAELEGVRFLTDSQLTLLPVSVLEAMGVNIEANDTGGDMSQAEVVPELDVVN